MPYIKRYNLKKVLSKVKDLLDEGRVYMDIEDLLVELDFEPMDINMLWVKRVKYRIRYDRKYDNRYC